MSYNLLARVRIFRRRFVNAVRYSEKFTSPVDKGTGRQARGVNIRRRWGPGVRN